MTMITKESKDKTAPASTSDALYLVVQAFYLGNKHCAAFDRVVLTADQALYQGDAVRLAEQATEQPS